MTYAPTLIMRFRVNECDHTLEFTRTVRYALTLPIRFTRNVTYASTLIMHFKVNDSGVHGDYEVRSFPSRTLQGQQR